MRKWLLVLRFCLLKEIGGFGEENEDSVDVDVVVFFFF